MSTSTIRERVVDSFRSFVNQRSPEQFWSDNATQDPASLAEYIQAWLEWGDGVQACLGDYEVYLIGVITIIDEWTTDLHLLDYRGTCLDDQRGDIERRVASILGTSQLTDILDPHYVATVRFQSAQSRT